jgi:hypothetical protein
VLDLATGRQLQKLRLDDSATAAPIVVANRVLIGTNKGTLFCFGARP